jgi:murein DD-endopeptidase MepM/ murein hydrolase activator NlpD
VRIGEPCPAVAPARPDYSPYFLSPQAWPQPDIAAGATHWWLSKPLPGSGRLLINQSFPYGWDGGGRYLLHNGVDTAEELGTPVLAAADGTVVVARADETELFGWRCDWYGQLVVIELDEQWQGQPVYTLYGHVLNIIVQEGERVTRGQPLAEVGIGGVATVPHLHFEVRVGENRFDSTRNPMLWIRPAETRGVIAGRIVDPEGRPWQGVTLTLINTSGEQGLTNTWSYLDDPQHLINPDEGLAENFVFADVLPGDYDVYTKLQGVEYRVPVMVLPGEIVLVEIVTEPYKTPMPTSAAAEPPSATPTPELLPSPTLPVTIPPVTEAP